MTEEDLIIGGDDDSEEEEYTISPIRIIESQIDIINSIYDLDDTMYVELREDKIKVMVRALRIMYKIQSNILKEI